MNRADRAEELFRQGYNCGQSVFAAFADVLGLTVEEAAKIASPFGAGFGKLREVCGAVSGMTLSERLFGSGRLREQEGSLRAHSEDVRRIRGARGIHYLQGIAWVEKG